MKLKILLADDSMTAQAMGKKILSEAGYDVVTVSNGAAAMKKIPEIKPDLVLLDVYMPGYSGLEVCQQLRGDPSTCTAPVLLTVGKLEPFRSEDGIRVKADGVIVKPFEATDLIAVVGQLAERVRSATPASLADAQMAAQETVLPRNSEPESPKLGPADDPVMEPARNEVATAVAVADDPDTFPCDAPRDELTHGEATEHSELVASGSADVEDVAVAQTDCPLDVPVCEEMPAGDLPAAEITFSPDSLAPAPFEAEAFEIVKPQLEVAPQTAYIGAATAEPVPEEFLQRNNGANGKHGAGNGNSDDGARFDDLDTRADWAVIPARTAVEENPMIESSSAISTAVAAPPVIESFAVRLEPLPEEEKPTADPWPTIGGISGGSIEITDIRPEIQSANAELITEAVHVQEAEPMLPAALQDEQAPATIESDVAQANSSCELQVEPDRQAGLPECESCSDFSIVPQPEAATVELKPECECGTASNHLEWQGVAAEVAEDTVPERSGLNSSSLAAPAENTCEPGENASEQTESTLEPIHERSDKAESSPSAFTCCCAEDVEPVESPGVLVSAETPVSEKSPQVFVVTSEAEISGCEESACVVDPPGETELQVMESAVAESASPFEEPVCARMQNPLIAASTDDSASATDPVTEALAADHASLPNASNADVDDPVDKVTTSLAGQLADRVLERLRPQLVEEIKKILRGQ